MEDLSKYSTEELEAMLQDSPQPQSAQPSQTQAPQATQEPASDMPDLSQYSTEALERMIGEQGTAEGRIEQMFNVGTDRRDEIDPLEEAAKGAGRAVKAIGGAFVGLGSGAVRLAGTPVRALTGWDGLHRVADSIDSGYEDWGSEALASELPDDDWGRVIGGFGEKMAGTAGSLGAMAAGGGLAKLGAAGKLGAASKAVGTAGAALQKSLPLMFGNDAAVRTYDTAKENGSCTARALGLASVNGAIHYFGFKAFENQSLNKMLGMPQEMGAMMPAWANAAMAKNAAGNTFTSLASGVRNGMYKYILAERAKGALKAGGIMGLQNFLSSVPTQMAEGAGVGDVDWGRAVSEGVGGVEEGALMEALMGGAAALKTPKAARKFISETLFRKGWKASNGENMPGLLHSPEGRAFVMKQNPEMQRRILDILDHGGKVTKGELNAACLPPDMTEAELREFAKNWRKDLASEWDRAAEPEALGEGEELEGNEPVIPREQQMRNRAKVNEMRDHDQRVAEADAAERARVEEQAADDAAVAAEEAKWAGANAKADAERAEEAAGAEQLAREEAYPQPTQEQSAAPEQTSAQEPTEPPVAERSNRLRRNLKPKFRHQGENQQQPKEVTNETGDVPVEAQPEPAVQDAGRGGQQQAPQAAERPVEVAAPRGEVPAAGEVAEARPAEAKPVAPAPAATQEPKPAEPNHVSKSDGDGQKLTGEVSSARDTPTSKPLSEMTNDELLSAITAIDADGKMEPDAYKKAIKPYKDEIARRNAIGRGVKPDEANDVQITENVSKRTMDDAFGDFIDENGKPKTISQLIDNGWRVEKARTGAASRYRLVKDGVDGFHDLSSKKIKGRMRPGNYAWNIEAATKYSDSAEPPKSAPASAPRAEGTTTPPQSADAPQGAESAAGGAAGGAAEEPKPTQVNKLRRGGGKKGKKLEAQEPKADAAPATQEATPEATTTPAPAADEQTQQVSEFRDKNGNMKKTLRGAVERIASAIGNRTGKGAITPEEADAIVNGIAESPEVKHNRSARFFTPLVTDAEWQNSLGVDAESAKNLRDAVVRAKTDSEMAHFFVQVDKAVKKAKDGKLSPKDAVPLNGKISEGLEKAEREGRAEAAKRLREALEVIKPVVDAVSQEDVDKFNRSAKGQKLHTQLDGSDRRRGSRGKTVSLDTKDGTVNVGVDGRTLEDVADEISDSSHDRRTLKPGDSYGKGFTAESDNDTTGTEGTRQGATGKGGRRGGNRVLRIDEIDGDDVIVSLLDSTGRDRGVQQKMNREQWETLARAGKSLNKADPSNPQVGDNIMMSRGNAESPASRDERFAADADYQRWLKARKANDAEPLRQRYEMEQAKALGNAFKNAVGGVDVEYVGDRDYDPAIDGGGDRGRDVRHSRVTDNAELERLNGGETVKVYRAMQMIDGKLYPPMAAKVDGKLVEPTEIGTWYRADERPDLIKDGKFKLDKANGAAIEARYNPYFHTSRSPLNDQFSSANKRPNLVTVEVEIPKSELTSGYRAEGAKDAVGEMDWHSGPVSSKLPRDKARKVILSRWAKVVRVVPDAEVADVVARTLNGERLSVPENTVTPSLRRELEQRGVRISNKGEPVRYIRDRDTGTVLGIFDRDTGKLKLFRGANWKTLNHELGGHATMRFAEQEAARGNRALLDKINESIDNAPQWLKDEVKSRYPDADEATLRDEIWAALRERPSEAMQKYVKTLQGRRWYNRAWDAIKTAWRGILSRMGFNRADLSGIDKMTPDEFNEFLDKAMIGGKTLGRIETQGGEKIGNKLRKAFGGGLARVLPGNIGRYREAERMVADGASREDIWRRTGWWKGKDGKWRVELPDIKISNEKAEWLRNHAHVYPDEPVSLESLIEAPELFRAYPSLKKIKVYASADRDIYGLQILDRIYLNRDLRVDKYRTVLAHEIQHVIQDFENFAKGGNLEDAKRLVEQRHPLLIKARDELVAIAKKSGYEDWARGLSPEERRSISNPFSVTRERIPLLASYINGGYSERPDYAKKMPEVNRMINKLREAYNAYKVAMVDAEAKDQSRNITPTKIYNAFAGEVEARNVESRIDMSPEERAATPPWETEDVPESEQIVRTGDGGGASESRGGRQSSVRMARGPVTPGPDVRIMDDEVKWIDRQGERFVDSTHNLRKVQSEVGYRDRSDPKSVGVEEVMDPKTGFVDWRKSSDIQKAIVKSNGFVQKNEHILQVRRDRATREMAKMKGLSEDAKRELVDDYLTALHAEERNRTIADRRGDTYNDDYAEGAGRSAKWARDFIANDPNVQKYKAELDRIADIVHEAVVEDLRLRHENGLLSDDEYNFYSKKWKHYVPLRTDVTEGSPEGGAFNTSTATFNRSEYRTAKGRGADNIASSPFAFAFVQAHDGIGKSAKNIIGNVTANFIDMTEAKGLNSTKVEVVAKDGSKSTKTEYRIAEVVPADVVKRGGTKFAATFADGTTAEIGSDMRLASHQDNLVLFKRPEPVIGKDGKPTGETAARLYVAKFTEGKNGRGLAVAKAITGKNMVEVPFWVQPFSKATHFLSRMNTSASPSFLTSNIFNDRNEAWRAMSARFGVLDGAKMAAKVWKYRYADGKDLKNWLENGELRPGSDVADFINGGAAIKGGNIAQGFSGETSSLKDNLARQERKARSWWERFKRIGRFENVREIASSVGDVVQSANELEELGTRYGVYHAVLDELVAKGVPREVAKAEAVTFCRGATTDFNVRGTLAPVIGSFYMFYNANVQGTRRNIQSLTDKRGVQTFATLAGVASAMTVLRYWLGNDEEREKGGERNAKNALEYQKQSAMGIPIPSGRELSILKMRGVDALIPYAATKFTEAALYDDVSAMEALADSLKAVGGEALGVLGGNGVGNKSQISQTLAPSLADPFVQWATGTDWQGERRVKQLMDKTVPQSYNARHGTSDVFKWIAETVNDISGGNQYRKGVVDMAPEDVQLIVETLAGGLGRDITGAINTFSNVKEVAKGGSSERLFGRMPVVKSLVREYPDSTSRYFDALDEYNADKAEFKKTTELGRRAEMKKEHPYLTANKGRVDTLIERVQELTHRERGEVKVGQKWVPMKTELPEARKEAFRKRRLRLQAEVLRILGK